MPFTSLQQAVYRSDGKLVMNAEERIDIHSAIAAFTRNGAKLFGHADRVGTLEAGKAADIIAISQNIVELAERGEPQRIGDTRVTLTIFDGKVVYERPAGD
jgi:predicted amidohydrolase YtcJ